MKTLLINGSAAEHGCTFTALAPGRDGRPAFQFRSMSRWGLQTSLNDLPATWRRRSLHHAKRFS